MVRLTDRPDMTIDVYRGRKTTKQYNTIGAHPLTVELVGDALDGDLHFCYLAVVKGLSGSSEGLLRSDILEEHQDALHAAGGHV